MRGIYFVAAAALSMTMLLTACQNRADDNTYEENGLEQSTEAGSSRDDLQEKKTEMDGGATVVQVQPDQSCNVMETAPGSISLETAKTIAIKDAGISREELSYSAAKLEWDDGRQIYDVEFCNVGIEYEYEILASDGTILKKKQDAEWTKSSGALTGNTVGHESAVEGTAGTRVAGFLTIEQVRQKVAQQIPGVDPANIYVKEDYDYNQLKYEGEVFYNQTKYEFELDGATGIFMDWEEEVIR